MRAKRIKPTSGAERGGIAAFGFLSLMGGLVCGLIALIFLVMGTTSAVQFFAGLGAFFLIVGAWLIWRVRLRSSQRNEWDEGHTAAEALVVSRDFTIWTFDLSVQGYYRLTVQFDANSGPYELDAKVGKQIYNSVKEGQTIGVRYADSDPRMALLEGER